jgi:hypothetical protein
MLEKDNQSPLIIDIKGRTATGFVELQAPYKPPYLYQLIRTYFEQELLNSHEITDTHLQSTLSRRAQDIPLLHDFAFDSDIRVIEISILLGVIQTLDTIGGLNKDYVFVPAWQKPGQKDAMKSYSTKESWDGFIVGMSKGSGKEDILIPLEIKSLMTDPKKRVVGNPNDQLKSRLKKFRHHFQNPGALNCVLVMPYTTESNLGIDLKHAADDLRSTIISQSLGFVCMLSFPKSEDDGLAMSILFALVSQNPLLMSASNTKEWMCEINFGKASTKFTKYKP